VACWLTFDLQPDTVVALRIAVAPSAGDLAAEDLVLTVDGEPIEPLDELVEEGGRIHVVGAPAGGRLAIAYAATVVPSPEPVPVGPPGRFDLADVLALQPSAYARSDLLTGFAAREFDAHRDDPELPERVARWVFGRLAYDPAASAPLDAAADTLLKSAGVCRDFAHLTATLCRALYVPARVVAAYAPGLSPMDFHAVVEVRGPDGWRVLDATRLAPRSSLVRIATGRDAADTAFATTLRGSAELVATEVFAVVEGSLPADAHRDPVSIP